MKGVYAGSFDPPTNGHLWMIKHGAGMFDELVLAIGVNPSKKSMFSVPEREKMLKEMTKDYKNVKVTSFNNQYLVRYSRSINADYMLRGIRSYKDYEYENGIRQVNEDIDEGILTVFLMPSADVSKVSSSFVKGLVGPKGWEEVVKRYVPPVVYKGILAKFNKRRP
ncbi:MAG: pantetheine-phosphate adenylyltransferase [Candidatus Micrarchaeaceae archaeon]